MLQLFYAFAKMIFTKKKLDKSTQTAVKEDKSTQTEPIIVQNFYN